LFCFVLFCFWKDEKVGFCYVVQASLKHLGSSNPPKIVHHHTQLFNFLIILLAYNSCTRAYIVIFTYVLTIYHSWIYPLHHSLFPPPLLRTISSDFILLFLHMHTKLIYHIYPCSSCSSNCTYIKLRVVLQFTKTLYFRAFFLYASFG
jgi:hypothetical protein